MIFLPIFAAIMLALACAVLSIFIVTRRWAFLGEGIAHAGFGGAGCAWLLALAFPAFNTSGATYLSAIVFCLAAALAIGYIQRSGRVQPDSAIGIFLVASLAWGFLAQQLYTVVHPNTYPPEFGALLFGRIEELSGELAMVIMTLSLGILLIIWLLWKELLSYAVDPEMAAVSGVKAALVHYSLIVLITLGIILGMRVAGSVLVTAMLILPGATAILLARSLRQTIIVAVIVAILGAMAAPLAHWQFTFLPQGPIIVLVMFALFIMAYGWSAIRGR